MIFRTVAISLRKFDWHSIIQGRSRACSRYYSMFHVPFSRPWHSPPPPSASPLEIQPPFLAVFPPSLTPTFLRHHRRHFFPPSRAYSFLPFSIVVPRMEFTDWRKGRLTPFPPLASRQSALYSPSCFHRCDEIYCAPVRVCTIQSSALFMRAYLLDGASPPSTLHRSSRG